MSRPLFILDDKMQLKRVDCAEWHLWMDSIENRRVAQHELYAPLFEEDVLVSTYFTGLLSASRDLFETIVIGAKYVHDDFHETYESWVSALIGHHKIVRDLKREKSSTPT